MEFNWDNECFQLCNILLQYQGTYFTAAHHLVARIFWCDDNQKDPLYSIFSELSKLINGYYIYLSHAYSQNIEKDLSEFCSTFSIEPPKKEDLITIFSFDYITLGDEVFLRYISRAKTYLGNDNSSYSILKTLLNLYVKKERD